MKIEELICESVESLKDSLEIYWPVFKPEKNSISEANLTFHFASVALKNGFTIYPEASDNNGGRIDLLVLGKINNKKIAFLVESKRLYSAQKAESILNDFKKIKKFRFNDEFSKKLKDHERYSVLLAITTQNDISEWWLTKNVIKKNEKWKNLKAILSKAEVLNKITILTSRQQHVLYAIHKIKA